MIFETYGPVFIIGTHYNQSCAKFFTKTFLLPKCESLIVVSVNSKFIPRDKVTSYPLVFCDFTNNECSFFSAIAVNFRRRSENSNDDTICHQKYIVTNFVRN